MKELITMLEHRVPDIRSTRTWRNHAARWTRSFQEIQRLRNRRPEIYEMALTGLVNYIANRAVEELEGNYSFKEYRKVKRSRRMAASETS